MAKSLVQSLGPLLVVLVVSALIGSGVGALVARSRGGGSLAGADVVVSVPPLVELVRPLLRDGVEITSVVPPGRSVHGFEPSASDLAGIARAGAVVMVGMGLEERWGEQVRRQEAVSANIVTIADIARASLPEGEQLGRDPHLWVDPAGVRGWIVGVYDALPARLRRPRAEIEPFLARIDAVDAVYREALAPFAGAAVVTHHNAFGRMGRRYGIEISAVMVSAEGTEPSPAQIAEVRRVVETRNVRAMVVEPQFNDAPARRIAELAGVPVGVLDPLGADWFSMMQRNLETLTELLGKE